MVKEGVDVCNMIRMEASLLEGGEDNQFDEDVVKDEKTHANEVGFPRDCTRSTQEQVRNTMLVSP